MAEAVQRKRRSLRCGSSAGCLSWLERDVAILGKNQRRQNKVLSNVKAVTCEEELDVDDTGLTTLRVRREMGDLIKAFKTLN